MEPGTPGPKVSPDSVKPSKSKDLYTKDEIRTIFLDFDNDEWESDLEAFYNTDVEVPATVQVDGKSYPMVGVHFRGASSFTSVPAGNKRSLNLSFDFLKKDQNLLGARTLNLLNANMDPTFMSSVLYSQIANAHLPAPRANWVRVVINGESWGVYVNVEQFNGDFVSRNFPSAQVKGKTGARWKVPGNPQADGGLYYLGEDLDPYKQRFEIKSKDKKEDWEALVNLTKVLSQTPIEDMERVLPSVLDVESALWFLALDVALVNSDGYWTRASDYSIYLDPKGVFHLIPHDMNEAFRDEEGPGRRPGMRPGGGPGRPIPQPGEPGIPDGFPGGPPPGEFGPPQGIPGSQPDGLRAPDRQGQPRQGASQLDPFVAMNDLRKPLRSRLLQVPAYRAKYLAHVRQIANEMSWSALGPCITRYRTLLTPAVEADTRKNSSTAAFLATTSPDGAGSGPRNLRLWLDGRSMFLQNYQDQPKQGNR